MPAHIDLTGQKFGRLTVMYRDVSAEKNLKHKRALWRCKCDCGGETILECSRLTRGVTVSCGCVRSEIARGRATKHGLSSSRLYQTWKGMIARCHNPKSQKYTYYGGRGIRVCSEWRNSVAFITWALANGYADKLTIERKDSDGDYCPSNCCWATLETQANNKSNNRKFILEGITLSLSQAERKYGVSRKTLARRLDAGLSPKEAVFLPLQPGVKYSKRDLP